MKIRISFVDYLNSAPLGWAFLHGPFRDRFEVIPSSPAMCAKQLASGEVDIGLIPSIEYQRIEGLYLVPGIAIAALRKVRSVVMVRPKGRERIRTVALDTSSRSSVALLSVLFKFKMNLKVELVPHAPDLSSMLRRCDAALIIGDAALKLSPEKFEIMDLAEEWFAWQGQPFVFAFWACRENAVTRLDLVRIFHEAKRWGLDARNDIVQEYSQRLDLPAPFLDEYLRLNIDYNLESAHVKGLQMFFHLTHRAGLIEEPAPLRFLPAGMQVESPA